MWVRLPNLCVCLTHAEKVLRSKPLGLARVSPNPFLLMYCTAEGRKSSVEWQGRIPPRDVLRWSRFTIASLTRSDKLQHAEGNREGLSGNHGAVLRSSLRKVLCHQCDPTVPGVWVEELIINKIWLYSPEYNAATWNPHWLVIDSSHRRSLLTDFLLVCEKAQCRTVTREEERRWIDPHWLSPPCCCLCNSSNQYI